MSGRLPLITIVLAVIALTFAGLIVRELTRPPRVPTARAQPAASVSPTQPAPATPAAAAPPANYTVVASRNLFSPTRSEAPVTPPAPPPVAPVLPKPNLFGVVLLEGAPVAYLEDPVTKRVARYRVGDHVAGGTVKEIGSDTVMLTRPEGQVTVRLHDPTRPRPAAPTTPAGQTGPGVPPQGVMPEGRPTTPPSITTPRRPPIPGALGRIPAQPTDAAPPR